MYSVKQAPMEKDGRTGDHCQCTTVLGGVRLYSSSAKREVKRRQPLFYKGIWSTFPLEMEEDRNLFIKQTKQKKKECKVKDNNNNNKCISVFFWITL